MSAKGGRIVLSAGGDINELARHGLGMEHVDELMVRLSRRLLRADHLLAFGGTLGNPEQELTKLLIDAALGWLSEGSAKEADVTETGTWPLANYGAWPYYTFISAEDKAKLVGICHFVSVDPPGVDRAALKALIDAWDVDRADLKAFFKAWAADTEARRHTADALTEMRKRSTDDTMLRVVWGGKIRGAAGWMAGIAEEVMFSLKLEKPVLILGGFGGCARELADFLATEDAPWPKSLTLADACESDTYQALIKGDKHRASLQARYDELEQHVTQMRTEIHHGQQVNGVSAETLMKALSIESSSRAIKLVTELVDRSS